MGPFRVFLGAPSSVNPISELPGAAYRWHTVSSTRPAHSSAPTAAAAIEVANRRISSIYQNIIFKDDEEDESMEYVEAALRAADDNGDDTFYRSGGNNRTTMITWPPTPTSQNGGNNTTRNVSKSRLLLPNGSTLFLEETQDTGSLGNYSGDSSSSVARFPLFQFNLHSLDLISSLVSMVVTTVGGSSAAISADQMAKPYWNPKARKGSMKTNILVAVLEVDGPDIITIKRGWDMGKQVTLLKMIVGDENGNVCKITAWREVADLWGYGLTGETQPAIRRGDVVLFQNVLLCWEPPTTRTLNFTASPNLRSQAEICYRTIVYSAQDKRLRPDLRLGYMDAAVRRVASVVGWFEKTAGL